MQTLEELEEMDTGQLKGILESLDVAVPDLDFRKAENKAQLAQLVYDVQQPEHVEDEDDGDKEPEAPKEQPKKTDTDIDGMIQEIAEFFGDEDADIEPIGETQDGVTIFTVYSADGNELESGTFLELQEKMRLVKNQVGDLEVQQPEEEKDEMPEAPKEEFTSEIDERLAPLKRIGLKYEVQEHCVKLQFGAKIATTTVHQPVHRIVRAAEQLVGR